MAGGESFELSIELLSYAILPDWQVSFGNVTKHLNSLDECDGLFSSTEGQYPGCKMTHCSRGWSAND